MTTCKNCNSILPDGTRFCQVCGTKVEATGFCGNCGAPINSGSGFCGTCGAKRTEAIAVGQLPQPVAPAPTVVAPSAPAEPVVAEPVVAEPVVAEPVVAEPAVESLPAETIAEQDAASIKKKPFFLKKRFIIPSVSLLLVVAIVVGIFAVLGSNKEPSYILYMKDDELYYSATSNINPIEITDDDAGSICSSQDGSLLFYAEGYTLYYRNVSNSNSTPTKIDKNVKQYQLINKGKGLVYLTRDGDLYTYDLKNKVKISSDTGSFSTSADGKLIYFYCDGSLYLKESGKNKEKLVSDYEDSAISDNYKTVCYIKDDKLYKKTVGKEKVKLVDDVTDVAVVTNSGNVYYIGDDEVLFYHNGKESIELVECENTNICSLELINKDATVFVVDCYYHGESTYYILSNGNAKKIGDDINNIHMSEDGKNIHYTSGDYEESLYKITVNGSNISSPTEVADDVYDYSLTVTNDGKPVYLKDYEDGEGQLYVGDNYIADEVRWVSSRSLSNNNVVYITNYDDDDDKFTLWVTNGKKSTKIAEDVYEYYVNPAGDLTYLTDYGRGGGTLYLYKNNKSVKVDEDVTWIIETNPWDSRAIIR